MFHVSPDSLQVAFATGYSPTGMLASLRVEHPAEHPHLRRRDPVRGADAGQVEPQVALAAVAGGGDVLHLQVGGGAEVLGGVGAVADVRVGRGADGHRRVGRGSPAVKVTVTGCPAVPVPSAPL